MFNNTLKTSQEIEIEAIFLKHYKEWCLLSYSYIESMPKAEDVVQDVFVKILNRKHKNKIINLKSYISTSIRNTSLKEIGRTKRLEKINDYSLAALSPSHEQCLIEAENRIKVQEAIGVLPEKSKRVFELYQFSFVMPYIFCIFPLWEKRQI